MARIRLVSGTHAGNHVPVLALVSMMAMYEWYQDRCAGNAVACSGWGHDK